MPVMPGGSASQQLADAYRAKQGIPQDLGQSPAAAPESPLMLLQLLKSGQFSAEQLLQIVTMLAGLGQQAGAPAPSGGAPAPSPIEQAFQGQG